MIRLYAHRGYSAKFPENSRPAFEAAFQHGAHGIEADLQKCSDGTCVILHDASLDRTTNIKGSLKNLAWNHVSKARLTGAPDEPVLKLEELLNLLPADKLLNLELKSETITPGDIDSILAAISRKRSPANTMISSFDHDLLPKFRKAGFETGALLGEQHSSRGIARLLLDLLRVRPSHVNAPIQTFEKLKPDHARLFFQGLKTAGLKLAFWTINREEDFHKIRPFADAVISDHVEDALVWIRR
jgi:glycerophosphoryl diester phosphodiesterase